ncbi:MAG: transcriptional repressor LexA [Clostridia bacterium]|nr:transcriptional repressor LexA [Clostridia bacterium]
MQSSKRTRGDTQQRILSFIEQEIAQKGYPPSVREIGDAVGLKSTSTVHGHLRRLEARGLLRRDAMKPRAMEVRSNESAFSRQNGIQMVPLVGNVAAGSPILAEEYVEDNIALPEALLGEGKHFILKVHGDSMINAGIMDGDYVVVRQQNTANNGEIVVALIEGSATVKRFYRENGHIRLQPENNSMLPIITRSVDIAGKVVTVYRKY